MIAQYGSNFPIAFRISIISQAKAIGHTEMICLEVLEILLNSLIIYVFVKMFI